MNKRAVLEKLFNNSKVEKYKSKGQDFWLSTPDYDQALIALDKLEKEKMLEIVGEDMEHREIKEVGRWYSYTEKNYYPCDELINYGSNKAKDEIRKKINQPQDKERGL